MKYLIIISLLILTSCTLTRTEYYLITENGIGKAIINQSNLATVKKEFPNGKTTKHIWGGKKVKGSARLMNGESIPITLKRQKQVAKTYSIAKLGLSFYFDFKDTLSRITVNGNSQFKTDKGIIVGVSNFRAFESVYGSIQWSRKLNEGTLLKHYNNIIFYSFETDSNTTPSENLIIDKIVILIN